MFLILAPTIYRENQIKSFEIKLNDYCDYFFYLKTQKRDKHRALQIANNSLGNKFEFQIKTSDYPLLEVEKPQELWTKNNFYNNTHEFYGHSLIILWDLILAHQQTGNADYLLKGEELITSWINNNERFDPLNQRYAWEDHSTAKRIIAILLFSDYAKQYIQFNKKFFTNITKLTNYSAEFLNSDQNYSFNHNHGIYQDIALLTIALHCQNMKISDQLIKRANSRFEKQVLATFSLNGFHLENSPGYHFVTTDRCNDFKRLYKLTDYSLGSRIENIIKKANRNRKLFVMPNNKILNFGDTNSEEIVPEYEADSLLVFDQQAGYFIFKYDYNYLAVKTSSVLQTHRHYDDMSFIIFIDGEQLTYDPGFLTYAKTETKYYSKSMQAHNTIIPKEKLGDYNFDYNSNFVKYFVNDEFLLVAIKTKNENIYRNIIFDYSNMLCIIEDEIKQNGDFCQIINYNNNSKFRLYLSERGKFYHGSNKPKLGWKALPLQKLVAADTYINCGKDSLLFSFSKNKIIKIISDEGSYIIKTNKDKIKLNLDIKYKDFPAKKVPPKIGHISKTRLSYYRRNQLLFINIFITIFVILLNIICKRIKPGLRKFLLTPLFIQLFLIFILYWKYIN
ncbi:MAG: hypothetical protein PWQ09_756 [Candidatus Cloacimonadota bacterium]|nr:hypothetical protein [Candidatus Cloacimonadota bacterium]